MTTLRNLVLLPNNWVYDIDTEASWRLALTREDGGAYTIRHWDTDWRGVRAIGSPSGYTASGDPIFYEFDLRTRQESFSWQSQPIQVATERDASISELTLTATPFHADSTVVVTVFSTDDPTGTSTTFNFGAGQVGLPVKQRAANRIYVKGKIFQVKIVSASNTSGYEAPWIHGIESGILGMEDNLMVRSS